MNTLKNTSFGTQKIYPRKARSRESKTKVTGVMVSQTSYDAENCSLIFEHPDKNHHYDMDSTDAISVVRCILPCLTLEHLIGLQVELAALLQQTAAWQTEKMKELDLRNKECSKELLELKKKAAKRSG